MRVKFESGSSLSRTIMRFYPETDEDRLELAKLELMRDSILPANCVTGGLLLDGSRFDLAIGRVPL